MNSFVKIVIRLTAAALVICFTHSVSADNSVAVQRLSEYLRIDTINPPGNESRGVAYLGAILDAAGIPFERAESAPGRGNLWTRLKAQGKNSKPALVLLHHIDVVPADAQFWDFDPLSGDVANGFVYGRGAIDTKGLGIVQLQAFLNLAASGRRLNRDVWLIATADEEAGGEYGAGWLAKTHPEIFANVGFLLNEGGSGRRLGTTDVLMVEVTQKVPLWLRLTASGRPGHGSMPQVETSVTRLVRATQRIAETRFPPRVIPAVADMLEGIAPYSDPQMAQAMANPEAAVADSGFMLALQLQDPATHALLRNTCSITRLEGSNKINVVPPLAHAELDCRLLPDQNPDEFIEELALLINDPEVRIERLMGFTPASSRTDTALYADIVATSEKYFPGAVVVPTVSTGFTDSHFFRDMGITSYGYSPFLLSVEELRGIHGNNERVSVQNIDRGVDVLTDLLLRFATSE